MKIVTESEISIYAHGFMKTFIEQIIGLQAQKSEMINTEQASSKAT